MMGYAHLYPWQLATKRFGVKLTCKLDPVYDVPKLQAECNRIIEEYSPANQFGDDHEGGWKAVCLVSSGGDPYEDRYLDGVFTKTPVLNLAPYMESIIDGFPGQTARVRLMQLLPRENIFWHFDGWQSLDQKDVRLHIPIVTNSEVQFQISHEDCRWLPGELWYGDFTFPHRLYNGGDSPRVHLVMDFVVDNEIKALFPRAIQDSVKTRRTIRKLCARLCQLYTAKRYSHH